MRSELHTVAADGGRWVVCYTAAALAIAGGTVLVLL